MSQPMSKEQLAKMEVAAEAAWQEAIKEFQDDFPSADEECKLILQFMMANQLLNAGLILSAALMKLHVAIGQQTGKMLTRDDIQEVEDLRNQRNRN